jgi:hypothetical protein
MNFNEDELIHSLKVLIKEQNENETMPYYLVSDVLLAHITYSKNLKEESKAILDNLLDQYNKKITILSNFFKGYVIEFRNVLLRSQDDDLLELTNQIIGRYF